MRDEFRISERKLDGLPPFSSDGFDDWNSARQPRRGGAHLPDRGVRRIARQDAWLQVVDMEPMARRLDGEGKKIFRKERNVTIINTSAAGTAGSYFPGDRERRVNKTTVMDEGRIYTL
ncbi:hypothetical protein GF325_07065 [Candidatus Bathyarchaeota archaeon]|nr:hypothetical protein [Candidatus Bathyarchaeota archaeon]